MPAAAVKSSCNGAFLLIEIREQREQWLVCSFTQSKKRESGNAVRLWAEHRANVSFDSGFRAVHPSCIRYTYRSGNGLKEHLTFWHCVQRFSHAFWEFELSALKPAWKEEGQEWRKYFLNWHISHAWAAPAFSVGPELYFIRTRN